MPFKKTPFWVKRRKPISGALETKRAVLLAKFTQRRRGAAQANQATPVDVATVTPERVRTLMHLAELDAYKAKMPRPDFRFDPGDVVAVYTQKGDDGPGLWFGLKDGRVFRSTGEPDSSDPGAYGDAEARQ